MPLFRAEHVHKRRLFRPVLIHDLNQTLYLPFDHDDGVYARDRSGYNNHGTIYGATQVSGKIADALSFDGVDDYVEIPDSVSLSDYENTDELTVLGWWRLNTIPPAWTALISKPGPSGAGFNLHYTAEETFYLWLALEGTRTLILTHLYPELVGNWTFIAFTVKAGVSRLYINGVEVKTASHAPNLTDAGGVLRINSGSAYWGGTADELRIFNRALSTAEIQRLMNMRMI